MFTRKFWRDAGEAFLIAVLAVAVVDGEQLIAAGSIEQAGIVGIGLARAAAVAGLRAVAPRILAYRSSDSTEL